MGLFELFRSWIYGDPPEASRKRRGEDISSHQDAKLRCVQDSHFYGINNLKSSRDLRIGQTKGDSIFTTQVRTSDVRISNWSQNGKENCLHSSKPSFAPVMYNMQDCVENRVQECGDDIQVLEEHNYRTSSIPKRNKDFAERGNSSVNNVAECSIKDDDIVELHSPFPSTYDRKSGKVMETLRTALGGCRIEEDVQIVKECRSPSVGVGGQHCPSRHQKPFKSIDPSSTRASSTPIVFTSCRTLNHSQDQPEIEVLPSPSMVNGLASNQYQPQNSMISTDSSSARRNHILKYLQRAESIRKFEGILSSSAGLPRRTPFTVIPPKAPNPAGTDEVQILRSPPTCMKFHYTPPPSLETRKQRESPEVVNKTSNHIHIPVESKNENEPCTSASRHLSEDSEIQCLGHTIAPAVKRKTYEIEFLQEVLEKYKEKERESKELEEDIKTQCKLLEERNKHAELLKKTRDCALTQLNCYLEEIEEFPLKLEEDEIPTLPELTPEMESEIDKALSAPQDTVLASGFNITIKGRDMRTLRPLAWLNDEVINFYMNLLIERGKGKNYPSVHAFNTFFFPKLLSNGYDSLKRWTKKVDVFAHDFLLVPVHRGMHWCMAIIDMKEKVIRYYDSMNGRYPQCADALLNYLQKESLDKKKQAFDTSGWCKEHAEDIPQQNNGSDCGMFACMYAEYVSRGVSITFTQDDMPYFRRKAVYEILKAKLLC